MITQKINYNQKYTKITQIYSKKYTIIQILELMNMKIIGNQEPEHGKWLMIQGYKGNIHGLKHSGGVTGKKKKEQ